MEVSKEEFDKFIHDYPRKLEKDVAGMYEPPLLTFNDFMVAPMWPRSVVASVMLYEHGYPNDDGSKRPNKYFIGSDT